jgi:hypothetical protein
MRYISILILSTLGYSFSFAQNGNSNGEKFAQGNKLLLKKNYSGALICFLDNYGTDSLNNNLNYKIGLCYINLSGKGGMAVKFLENAVKNISKEYDPNNNAEKAAPTLAYYYLGVACQLSYHFAEASTNLKIYKKSLTAADKTQMEEVSHRITQCNTARMFIMAPNNARLINFGDSVNSQYADYNPLVSQDVSTVIFTSRRSSNKNSDALPDGEYHSRIYISNSKPDSTWGLAHLCGPNINSFIDNTACCISADGQAMLLYCNDGKAGALYQTRMGDNDWDVPLKMGSDVNTGNSTSACISPDGNALYFVSDRPGGMGGKDIWRCVKLPNGAWSKSLNLGEPINSPYNEESPFMHGDGRTFFFSSEGHNSMGGYDIFFSQLLDSGKFSEPFNLGYPINTPDDELHFSLGSDGKNGYLNSNRSGGKGGEDLYRVIMPHASERPLTVIKGQILPSPGESLSDDVHIIATDNASNQEVGDFKPIKATGKFTIIVPPGRTYTLSYQDDDNEFYKEVINVPNDAGYKEIHKELTLSPHPMKGPGSDTTKTPKGK